MRAHEIMEQVTPAAEHMMLKLRKGSAAGLTAKMLTEILTSLDGWKIENTKMLKPSDGGWVLGATPFGEAVKKMRGNHGGRSHNHSNEIVFHADYDTARVDAVNSDWNEQSKAAYAQMKNDIVPLIQANMSKKGRYEIRDLKVNEFKSGNYQRIEIAFEFYVVCSAYVITSPDGQTYEVCGDFKNGAVEQTTFETFYKWAVANTTFMDQILAVLNMEPVEAKIDPRKPYSPPPTASEETKKVFELLKELTSDIRAQQKVNMIEWMNEQTERYIELMRGGDKENAKNMWGNYSYFLQHAIKDGKVNPAWKDRVADVAEEQVEAMQNQFVYKNTTKLSPILSAKGNVGKQEVISANARNGVITATLKFSFDDGASFRVDQSVVMSHARDQRNNVTWFYRFPTTFHDVVLPGGEKMGYPSEERMNEIFAHARAA